MLEQGCFWLDPRQNSVWHGSDRCKVHRLEQCFTDSGSDLAPTGASWYTSCLRHSAHIFTPKGGEHMAAYDLNLILNPSLDAAQLATEKEYIENAIKNAGGVVTTLEEWGNRRMAYAIQKEREGYYLIYKLEMPQDKTNAIQTSLRLRDHIRRVLVVKQRPEWRTKKQSA
jgi:small subunit ribosomal protein S6